MIIDLTIRDPKVADFLLKDPVHPHYSEKQLFMRVHCNTVSAIWMLVKGCFER